jgi:hypothetical protein
MMLSTTGSIFGSGKSTGAHEFSMAGSNLGSFSAVSPLKRRAIRIIQFEPTERELEFVAYPDTFGGSVFDPKAIHELVISCALSDKAATLALSLMRTWVEGRGLSFDLSEAGLILSDDFTAERIYDTRLLYSNDRIEKSALFYEEAIYGFINIPAA